MSFNPGDMLEVDCRRLRARLTQWGCRKRQLWSLTHAWDPAAMVCWECARALPQVRQQAAPLLARIKSGRWCPECGERERAVSASGLVLPLCPECLRRKRRELWGLVAMEGTGARAGSLDSAVG
jgi:hypothetical protein